MEKKIVEIRTLKPGKCILIDDEACKITSMTHSKPGKHGGAKVKIDTVGMFDDKKRSIIKPAGQKIETPVIDKKSAQVLAVIGSNLQVMDLVSYETFDVPVPEDMGDITEGMEIMYMELDGKKRILQVKGE